MTRDLQLRGYSPRTQEAYLRAVRQLAAFYRVAPDQLKEEQVRYYILHLKNEKHFAPSSLKIATVGIRFFYTHTEPRDWKTLKLVRVERQQRLPDVLTREEVHAIIAATRTIWNRTYFWTVYSCGLRLHEALHLQVGDIDSRRMMIHVHRAKGAKDRYVPLPASTLQMLRDYWKTHRNPVGLFPAHGRSHKLAATADHPRTPQFQSRRRGRHRRRALVGVALLRVGILAEVVGARRGRRAAARALPVVRRANALPRVHPARVSPDRAPARRAAGRVLRFELTRCVHDVTHTMT
jgi:integrase